MRVPRQVFQHRLGAAERRHLHTAHHHIQEIVVEYPYHPLHGQRVIVSARQQHQGAAHYRVLTESGRQCLVPQWMCEPHTFDASPADHVFIDPPALLDLQRLVAEALSSQESSPSGPPREERR